MTLNLWLADAVLAVAILAAGSARAEAPGLDRVALPTIDLNDLAAHQVVVDKEPGQYLGHPTTCLLEDGKTILCVYPKGHGRGAIVYRRSTDGGRTWSDRLPTPANWTTSLEVPTLHRVIDPQGVRRVIMWSGRYPARLAVSEDDGNTWSPLKPVGDWGGIVVMGFVEPLKTGKGHYMAMFHDDGRYFAGTPRKDKVLTFTMYQTNSTDGGLTWSHPKAIWSGSDVHLCEPGCIRSPDGKQMAVLLRENARRKNSHVIFSDDEGQTWTKPRELPLSLTGDRHTGKYGPDGRLFISFRVRSPAQKASGRPFEGDWGGWVGAYDDIVHGRQGQYVVRIKDNTRDYDTAYPGVEVLPDGTFVTTTYGHWDKGEQPYIRSARFTLKDLDQLAGPKAENPGRELRLIQYNIRSFEGYAANWDRCTEVVKHDQMIERFALELSLYSPDVICLEEVPSEAAAARLAARMGMHYTHFKGGWTNKGWPEGISGAVLSKYPIVEAKTHPSLNWTDRPQDLFTRFWGRAVLETPAGPLVVHAMHGYHADSKIRLRELAEVLPVVRKDIQAGKSVILMGDLNHEPDSQEYKQIAGAGLSDSFAGSSGAADLLTCPSTVRKERIDYIWSAGPISKRLKSAKVLFEGAFRTNPDDPTSYALSDHVPVLAAFSMP